jgi:deoxycytidine triphosphate deaminase
VKPRTRALLRSLRFRLDSLADYTSIIRGERTGGRSGLREALDVISLYPPWIRQFVDDSVRRTKDDSALATLLATVAQDVVFKTMFVEEWFSDAGRLRIPLSLAEAVERHCKMLKLGKRRAVLAVGAADNFETTVQELHSYLFEDTQIGAKPPRATSYRFAMLQVPRLEGAEALWWPIVLGHELAHLVVANRASVAKLQLAKKIDWSKFKKVKSSQRLDFLAIAEAWATELLCDAYAVSRFGPAGAAAVAEFLDLLGSHEDYDSEHPPGWLRFRLMSHWMGQVPPIFEPAISACRELGAMKAPSLAAPYSGLLTFLLSLADDYWAVVRRWGSSPYVVASRASVVEQAVADLRQGIPPKPRYTIAGKLRDLTEEDVVNAGWIEWERESKWPVARLVAKSLDSLAFVRHWTEAGGSTKIKPAKVAGRAVTGVLSGEVIQARLNSQGDSQLVITPLLPNAAGTGSLDIRLGSHFIVFHRADTPSIKTFDPNWDPREVQRAVEVGWGDRFVLHPNELVLASTLEYFRFPPDLAAQVITRSSYGRLGLITATAVEVHPYFRGCLTLELVNLGEVPLQLLPGERIAQLVFSRVDPPAGRPKRGDWSCPIGPEFSRPTKRSVESRILSRMVRAADSRRGRKKPPS